MTSKTVLVRLEGDDIARLELIRDHDGNDLSPNDTALLTRLIDAAALDQEERVDYTVHAPGGLTEDEQREIERLVRVAHKKMQEGEMPCDRPPRGWYCTRARGHDGPCAALPESRAALDQGEETEQRVEPGSGSSAGGDGDHHAPGLGRSQGAETSAASTSSEALAKAIELALPSLGDGPTSSAYGHFAEDCALVHMDHWEGLSMASMVLVEALGEVTGETPPEIHKRLLTSYACDCASCVGPEAAQKARDAYLARFNRTDLPDSQSISGDA